MNSRRYKQLRATIAVFVATIVALAIGHDSYLLASAGVVTGMVFIALARSRTKMRTDEREVTIQEKAARMTYAIVAPTIGVAAFLLLLPSKGGISIFSKGEWVYLESLGMIFAYLALSMIAIYAISYHLFSKKYGGSGDEK